MNLFASSLIALLLHESAHILTALCFGLRIKRIGFSWKGPYIVRETPTCPRIDALIAFAGSAANLLCVGLWGAFPTFGLVSLVLGTSNLIPLPGSDGKRILRGVQFSAIKVKL